jgi:hypothetical protein
MNSQLHCALFRPTGMPNRFAFTFAILALTFMGNAQDDLPIFKAEAMGAFVWGEDNRMGAVSSSVRDPLTGNAIHKLNHGGIEIAAQAGFETIRFGQEGELLNFTATIINNTKFPVSVRKGAASVDGGIALPLPVVLTKKGLGKRERAQVWELAKMNCFSHGFLPNEAFLSPNSSSKALMITPENALTVSFVVKDPRHSSVLCSVEGCFPKGTMRFSVTVNTTDFVFVWPGKSMVHCGG